MNIVSSDGIQILSLMFVSTAWKVLIFGVLVAKVKKQKHSCKLLFRGILVETMNRIVAILQLIIVNTLIFNVKRLSIKDSIFCTSGFYDVDSKYHSVVYQMTKYNDCQNLF